MNCKGRSVGSLSSHSQDELCGGGRDSPARVVLIRSLLSHILTLLWRLFSHIENSPSTWEIRWWGKSFLEGPHRCNGLAFILLLILLIRCVKLFIGSDKNAPSFPTELACMPATLCAPLFAAGGAAESPWAWSRRVHWKNSLHTHPGGPAWPVPGESRGAPEWALTAPPKSEGGARQKVVQSELVLTCMYLILKWTPTS